MDRKEYDALVKLIDQKIKTSGPRHAEYYRGYGRGIQFSVLGMLEATVQDHECYYNSHDGGSGDPYLEAFGRGYRDGCSGLKPEGTS